MKLINIFYLDNETDSNKWRQEYENLRKQLLQSPSNFELDKLRQKIDKLSKDNNALEKELDKLRKGGSSSRTTLDKGSIKSSSQQSDSCEADIKRLNSEYCDLKKKYEELKSQKGGDKAGKSDTNISSASGEIY